MQLWYLYLFLIALTGTLSSEDDPHCRPNLCMNSEVHVGCFQPKAIAEQCGKNNLFLNVNGALKAGILSRVNMLRNYVASGVGNYSVAARMPTMGWDFELQRLADRQVRQCDETGKFCANTEKYHYVATTEIRSKMKRNKSLKQAILDKLLPEMFLDVLGCVRNSQKIVPLREGTCVGHYMPLIQDHGSRMGCGLRVKGRTEDQSNIILLCHFSRANVNNMVPYEEGHIPGEKCLTGPSQMYQFLCNEEEVVDPNSMVVKSKMPPSEKMIHEI
ncbi:allergen Tab y 5.0101 [Drosophila santomea]|uniref:allergen Tab y 5.0101 n=1 Tax=Drosophila santomea TaxID=129105 RepID=UPI001954F320|nr:allergen Tab y 5.0101 [Drosophila santomea]